MARILAHSALLVSIVSVSFLAPQLVKRADASTLTVNTFANDVDPNNTLSIREAMMLATGDLTLAELTESECGQVSPALWGLTLTCTVIFPSRPPGASSSDTIVFQADVFPAPPDTQFIGLSNGQLPVLDTGNDTIDGTGVGVGISGLGRSVSCIIVNSNNNTVKGLQIMDCDRGINVFTIGPETNDNVIGGTTFDERNVIFDNFIGVIINGDVTGNRIIGNYIGTNADGTAAAANDWGVFIGIESNGNFVGGDTPGERNLISGNATGIDIALSDANVVSGNYVGTDVTGSASIPNGTGVVVRDSNGNTIGGIAAGDGNVISGNAVGVDILDDSFGNVIEGNLIGTDAAGENAVLNSTGIRIRGGARDNTIGGSTTSARNVIAGNGHSGVLIHDPGTDGNIVSGNYIGTDASGEVELGNDIGVNIFNGPQGTLVGGLTAGERNVIADSRRGILIHTGITQNNSVIGNYIGTDASGENALPNLTGIELSEGVLNNTIGGVVAGEGNLIAFNVEAGVRVDGEFGAPLGNTIRGNSVHTNGGKGIENLNGGNGELPPPVVTGFGSVNGTACADCTVDVYSDDEDEGRIYEGTVVADTAGNWTFDGQPAGPNATATATDAAGNTSEFSIPVPEPSAGSMLLIGAVGLARLAARKMGISVTADRLPCGQAEQAAFSPAPLTASLTTAARRG